MGCLLSANLYVFEQEPSALHGDADRDEDTMVIAMPSFERSTRDGQKGSKRVYNECM